MMNADMRAKVLEIMDSHPDMTIATVRSDGFPQATTVSFVHDGLTLYFGCNPVSQKARNIDREAKVSVTIDAPHSDWNEIVGLSLGGLASRVTDKDEIAKAAGLMFAKFPQVMEYVPESADDVRFYRIDPIAISVLDYSKGFGHCELIEL
ncbi:MAG: pyridoxamine 5'-phosphate oxidase family protein [Maricaulaceae bacterium]|jgi:hypothetical protein